MRNVSFEFGLDDYHAMQAHLCGPPSQQAQRAIPYVIVPAVALSTIVARSMWPDQEAFFAGFVAATITAAILVLVVSRRARVRLLPRPSGVVLCKQDVELSVDGIEVRTPHWQSATRWSGVTRVSETATHIFLVLDTVAAHTIPKSAFDDPTDLDEFRAFATSRAGCGAG